MTSRQSEIMDKITKIPLLSHSSSLLLQMMSDENYSIEKVEEIVSRDNVLTAKILKIVNSAAFALSRKITTVREAIPYLGTRLIQSLALSSSAKEVFGKKLSGYCAENEESLWAHSLKTAVASRQIADYCKSDIKKETAFTCGILHDIGKSVISSYIISENRVEDIIAEIQENPNADFLSLEERYVGMNHSQAGYLLSKHWELPEIFQYVILLHHSPTDREEEYRNYSFCVHLADTVAQMTGEGTGIDSMRYSLNENYTEYFKIDDTAIQKLIIRVEEEFRHIHKIFFEEN